MIQLPKSSFYFVRHGETDCNYNHIIMGRQDIPLNDKGVEQAEHAGYILSSIEISKVFSSSLRRAYKTASIIANICELDLEKMDDFCERGYGSLEGKNRDSGPSLSPISDLNLPEDGEKYQDFEKRILLGLSKVLLSEYQYPLIVSHSVVFKAFANILCDRQDLSCNNGEIFLFSPSQLQADKWELSPLET
jgi:uncharacterized phosphatase